MPLIISGLTQNSEGNINKQNRRSKPQRKKLLHECEHAWYLKKCKNMPASINQIFPAKVWERDSTPFLK